MFTRRTFARLAIAASALTALAFTSARNVGADEIGFLSFDVMTHTDIHTVLVANVTPMLNDQPLMIRFGDAPFTGPYIGGTIAHTGMNIIMVPNPHMSGWYTAECAGRGIDTGDDQIGLN
ncbi:MAG: hypothetical protein K8T90_20495 [Planctomycetes bacterium]|nr:hypothetical protein [Planctomycetota bacterium]